MSEARLMDSIMLALCDGTDTILERNNCGMAWMRNGAPVKFGVGSPGGADLVGVFRCGDGRGLAVYVEIKTPTGRQSPEQRTYEQKITRYGAVYVLLRSVEDALAWRADLRRRFARAEAA